MKITIRSWKLYTQKKEVKAAEKVGDFFKSPLLLKKGKLDDINRRFLIKIKDQVDAAYNEGVRFGEFIFRLVERRKKEKGIRVVKSDKRHYPSKRTWTQVFLMKIKLEEKHYQERMTQDAEIKRLLGWSRDEIEKYHGSNTFLLEWQGFQNALRHVTANHIARMADTGYMDGLYHEETKA